jgi:hypothetical protein
MQTTMHDRTRPLALWALLAAGLAACGSDPTGPGDPFDPEATAAALSDVSGAFQDDDVMASLELVQPALAAEGGLAAVLGPTATLPWKLRPAAPVTATGLSASMMVPIFPTNLLGRTFEWDDALGRYAVTDRAGAPADGVRFILYAVDPVTHVPATPLNELGFLDLTDESSASSTRLGVHAETGGTTRLDYFIAASYAVSTSSVTATVSSEGYASDGATRLDFDLAESLTVTDGSDVVGIDLRHELAVAGQDLRVVLTMTGDVDFSTLQESFDLALRIENGGNVTVMTGAVALDGTLDGSIRHNGSTVVTITGTTDAPEFAGAGDSDLTPAEIEALQQIFGVVENLFDLANSIFSPFADTGF